jgi:hypothetical protein
LLAAGGLAEALSCHCLWQLPLQVALQCPMHTFYATPLHNASETFAVFYESDQRLHKYELNKTDYGIDKYLRASSERNEHLLGEINYKLQTRFVNTIIFGSNMSGTGA